MVPVIVPFRAGGKTRLPESLRTEVALAMLGDVLEAAVAVGDVRLVTDDLRAADLARELGATPLADPGGGQASAVAAALVGLAGPCVVVNGDCPRVRSEDLVVLVACAEAGRMALVEAGDGTTNALALPDPSSFAPLFGPGSAARFRSHAAGLGLVCDELELPRLRDDVDTVADLERLGRAVGARTRALLEAVTA